MIAPHLLFPESILLHTALQTHTVSLALHHSEITLCKTEEQNMSFIFLNFGSQFKSNLANYFGHTDTTDSTPALKEQMIL